MREAMGGLGVVRRMLRGDRSRERDEDGAVPALVLAGSPRIVSMTSSLTTEARAAVLLMGAANAKRLLVLRRWRRPLPNPPRPSPRPSDHSPKANGMGPA